MNAYRWILGLLGAGGLALAGCSSPGIADPGYFLVNPGYASGLVSPVEFISAGGCVSIGRQALIGAIVVPRADTGYNLFDCSRLSRDSIGRLVRAYRLHLVEAKLRGASEVVPGGGANGYYQLIDFNVVCQAGNSYGSNGNVYTDSAYVLPDLNTNTCRNVRTYQFVPTSSPFPLPPLGTPGSPGFPSGPPPGTSVPYAPIPPPLVPLPDTTCATADTIPAGQAKAGQLGPLSSKIVQDSLNAILASSIATATEIAGYITLDANGLYHVFRGPMIADSTDNCAYAMGSIKGTGTLIARFHTHPQADGTQQTCRIHHELNGIVNNGSNGGGSNQDWDMATTKGMPMYTIDPNYIYRLDPGVDPGARPSNRYAWTRVQNGCAAL